MTEKLSNIDRSRLLDLARRALEARVRNQAPPTADGTGVLAMPYAAFVSIHRHGDLRGCLGRLEPDTPLGQSIVELSGAVADSDPRFAPVSTHELADLDIEISVLTPASEIVATDDIEIGRHGLLVEDGHRRGLLLPQVAVEHGWSRETFLEQTCRKAGLSPDAWKRGALVYVFEAEVFGEDS